MAMGFEIILSEDNTSFCMEGLDELEPQELFLENENRERRLVKRGPRLPAFFNSGA